MLPLELASQLKQELDVLRPLRPEDEQRIMQKFRLDGNYHSNRLEGNSLTYGETKALLLFNITAQGKPLQDHLEMTGHNEALKWIEEVVKEERPLTENLIRQLHQLILKDDYQVNAITPDGKPTKKWVRVGKYKTEPNHVKTVTGEIFYFATPEETPAKMHDLMEWFRHEAEQDDVVPILLAAEFHYRFIRTHPFDDGNGRTARILMNFILMQFGYPPAVIKTEDKQHYFAVLQQADAGVLTPFVEFITTNVVRSLEIMIKGAKGEDIEESDDLDKELALLEQSLKSKLETRKAKKIHQERTRESDISEFFHHSVGPLFRQLFSACLKFERFYRSSHFTLGFSQKKIDENLTPYSKCQGQSEEQLIECMKQLNESLSYCCESTSLWYQYQSIDDHNDFKYQMGLRVSFLPDNIDVTGLNASFRVNLSYGDHLTEEQIGQLVKSEAKNHTEVLKQKIEEIDKDGGLLGSEP
jgi:Fic family protein